MKQPPNPKQDFTLNSLQEFSGKMAHDFNNLLAIISGYCDYLLNRLDDKNPIRSDLLEIKKAGQRGAQITSKLLAFSGKQLLQPSLLSLNPLVSEAISEIRGNLSQNIDLAIQLESELWKIKADPSWIKLIIKGLVENSKEAIPGEGKITIKTFNLDLSSGLSPEFPHLLPGFFVGLSVTDNGQGIPPSIRDRVLEPFFTTADQKKERGFGLSSAYGIIQQSGGSLSIDSEPGKGTSVCIFFPPAEEIKKTFKPDLERSEENGPKTILIVEDEPMVLNLTSEILEMKGFCTLKAQNGNEALEIESRFKEPIHLLISDMIMPHMRGQELAEKISQRRPGIKVLYLSGVTETPLSETKSSIKAEFLEKPFTVESLSEKVQDLLGD